MACPPAWASAGHCRAGRNANGPSSAGDLVGDSPVSRPLRTVLANNSPVDSARPRNDFSDNLAIRQLISVPNGQLKRRARFLATTACRSSLRLTTLIAVGSTVATIACAKCWADLLRICPAGCKQRQSTPLQFVRDELDCRTAKPCSSSTSLQRAGACPVIK